MRKILFTTTFAKSAPSAWRYTLQLAQHFNAGITLMHVYEDATLLLTTGSLMLEEGVMNPLPTFNENLQKEQTARLYRFAEEHTPKSMQGIPTFFLVTTGDPVDAILEEDRSDHYDLIVIGTTRTNRFPEILFGSVSQKVIDKAQTPLFLVPPTVEYGSIKKILYATSFEYSDTQALDLLMEWVRALKAELHLIHVFQNVEDELDQTVENMKTLLQSFKEQNESGVFTYQLLRGEIKETIEKYLELTHSDMIALIRRKRGFFSYLFQPSITKKILSDSMVPVLLFPER